jgi:hypothetical protein
MVLTPNVSSTSMPQRDYVAVMALRGILANPSDIFLKTTMSGRDHEFRTAQLAYKFADAMIAASGEEPGASASEPQ